ncbi:ribosome biogenesis protein ytm1 [Coemansia sp. RSA 2598]|nr:ribosome biogenesis protein ytm1 [Coemansia sp. RSA 2598]
MRFAGSAAGQAQLWEPACAAEICELAARRFVIEGSGLPVSRKALSAFSTNESTLKLLDFEAALLALCSKGSETAAEARLPIHKAVGRVAELYTERRCEQALDRARALAEDSSFAVHAMDKHELWDADLARTFAADAGDEGLDCVAQQIDKLAASGSPEEAAAGSLETPVFPQCSISKSIHELVRLAYSLANEALLAGTEGAHAWIGALGDALDIYCALFPMLHQQELQRVPALGWQFVNDCMYAAHHASLLTRILPQLSDSPARAFLGAGDSQRRHLIQRQAEELAAQARGSDDMFYMASDEKKQVRLLKAAKQVRATLEHIARGMRPPATTPNVFYTVMGSCVDAVFDATIEAVVDVRDIGVDDSKALSDHCRRVLSLTALLPLDQQALAPYASLAGHGAGSADGQQGIYADSLLAESDDEDSDSEAEAEAEADGERRRDAVGSGGGEAQRLGDRYCRLKDKLAQLADILVISRADILARRRAGLLSQFAVDELVRLVRALFSDTSERARDIEVLKTELADM